MCELLLGLPASHYYQNMSKWLVKAFDFLSSIFMEMHNGCVDYEFPRGQLK